MDFDFKVSNKIESLKEVIKNKELYFAIDIVADMISSQHGAQIIIEYCGFDDSGKEIVEIGIMQGLFFEIVCIEYDNGQLRVRRRGDE